MTAFLDERPGDGIPPAVPLDWDMWDHSALPDVLTDDPTWCLPAEAAPWPPSPDDADGILATEPEELSGARAIDFLVELQKAQSRLAALEARALVAVAGAYRLERHVSVTDPGTQADREVTIADEIREEVAAALRRSPGVIHDQLVAARLLAGPLSATRRALAEGRITAQHARAIADQSRRLSTSHVTCHQPPHDDTPADAIERADFARACAQLQDRVLPMAERTTPARTRARARAVAAAIDAEGQEKRRQRAKAGIDVHIYPDEDGLAVLLARMPILHAVRVHAAIDALARARRGECDATLGQLRVDALVEALCDEPGTRRAQVITEIQVVLEAQALFGSSDVPGTLIVGNEGLQPIPANAVRELLDDPEVPATIRRLLMDPANGHLLDRGRRSYRVTDEMRAFLGTRDATCRHPGCTRAAGRCQIDHAVAWDDGGRTDRANLGPLCVRHHQLKTHAEWTIIESRPDGSVRWQSPLGRHYDVDAPPVLPSAVVPTPPASTSAAGWDSPSGADPPF